LLSLCSLGVNETVTGGTRLDILIYVNLKVKISSLTQLFTQKFSSINIILKNTFPLITTVGDMIQPQDYELVMLLPCSTKPPSVKNKDLIII